MVADPLFVDAWSRTILGNELAVLYEAILNGLAPPIPKQMQLQYADFAVWQRKIMRVEGPRYRDALAWWKALFSGRLRPVKLPFRRTKLLKEVAPTFGAIDWQIDHDLSLDLDGIAKHAGATHFVIRLALFVALVADLSHRSTVVIGTVFGNRRHLATRNIVGHFANLVPLVFSYDHRSAFRSWIDVVRDRLFETEKHAEIPYEELYDTLRATGLKPPAPRIMFTLSADHSDRQYGGLAVKRLHSPIGKMPWGCQIVIDERNPEDCRVEFNANLYDRKGMQAMIDRYVRLLEIAARQPDVTIGSLVGLSSDNALRRGLAAYRTRGGEKTALRRGS